jgi:uncharacterized protein DUF6544
MSGTPRGLTDEVRADWAALARPTETPPNFEVAAADRLPEPARGWVTHAIAPGTPLRTSVELRMHGQIRLGAWRPFTAVQRLTVVAGFVWAATARLLLLPVTGFDRFTRGTGQMRWRLLDAIPVTSAVGDDVTSAVGDDVTRSAAGRHAGELLLAAPAAALSAEVAWRPVDGHRATARVHVGRDAHEVTLTIAADGALTELLLTRWGDPDKRGFGAHSFGASLEGEASFDGFTIPRDVTAGWHYGSERWPEGQFIRYTIHDARYR